ncbi:MAG: hypothetical protein ABI867_10880 [Kofleriaceae bacterium]
MTEPPRLKEADGLGAQLLRSACDDRPSATSRRAIGAGLGLAVPVAIAKGTAAAAATHGSSVAAPATAATVKAGVSITAKLLVGITLATGAGIGFAVHRATTATSDAPSQESAHSGTEPRAVVPRSAAVEEVGAVVEPPHARVVTVTPPPPTRPSAARIVAVPPPASADPRVDEPTEPGEPGGTSSDREEPSATDPTPVAPARSSLTDEVAVLDVVLAAIRAHDPASALRSLDRYDRQFPNGALATEAAVARIEATLAAGDLPRGRALAAQFLAAHRDSPLAHRVRTLRGL